MGIIKKPSSVVAFVKTTISKISFGNFKFLSRTQSAECTSMGCVFLIVFINLAALSA